ncbi:expressed unknown protein [Seminavis robusta]|uniref:Uncharacterized protein n=1 Tax=Seminavis robusta TaxID=568900 RepID=A0A9N8EFA3_9STRA|nr:expressed unknown protein [Seminavis robusta]|eukprot:Sro853_g211090.1 n/a (109) ;mRNA; r:8572-8898
MKSLVRSFPLLGGRRKLHNKVEDHSAKDVVEDTTTTCDDASNSSITSERKNYRRKNKNKNKSVTELDPQAMLLLLETHAGQLQAEEWLQQIKNSSAPRHCMHAEDYPE